MSKRHSSDQKTQEMSQRSEIRIPPKVLERPSRSVTSATSVKAVVSHGDSFSTDHDVKSPLNSRADISASHHRAGEKPNDLLQRLYDLWPSQLTASYRPHAVGNPEATSEFNLRYIRELYPPSRRGLRRKTKAAGMVVETVLHLDKKSHYSLNLSGWARH